jgi:hypothetical protein
LEKRLNFTLPSICEIEEQADVAVVGVMAVVGDVEEEVDAVVGVNAEEEEGK